MALCFCASRVLARRVPRAAKQSLLAGLMGYPRADWASFRIFLDCDVGARRGTRPMTEKEFDVARLIIDELGSSEAVYFIARQIEEKSLAGEIGSVLVWKRILRAASKLIVSDSKNSLH